VFSEGSFAFFLSLSKIGQNSLVAKLTPIQQSAQGSITYRVYHHISFHCNSQNSFNQIHDPFRSSEQQESGTFHFHISGIIVDQLTQSIWFSFQLGSGVCMCCQILAE